MTQSAIEETRPASGPVVGMVRTTLGAGVVAATLIGGIGIANPVLAGTAVMIGTGLLSGTGKVSRDYLAKPDEQRSGKVGGFFTILAHAFSWLG